MTWALRSKKDIEAYGLAQFVLRCKERVLKYAAIQTEQSLRLGYWMDWNDPDHLRELGQKLMEDPGQTITENGPQGAFSGTVEQVVGRLGLPETGGSYFTFSTENNYMIWTFLKKCWEKGWVYRGSDVMPWCPRCATGISQHEIVTDGYQELTQDSVTVRFPLRGRPGEALLVWTTTPWTLSSNVAAAVGKDLTYVKVKNGDQILYLSKGTLHMLKGERQVLAELKGSEMVGWTYDGPFDELEAERQPGGFTSLPEVVKGIQASAAEAHQVIAWDEVGEAEGTGIVHIAPGCGAEDFGLGKAVSPAGGSAPGRRGRFRREVRLPDRDARLGGGETDLCQPGTQGTALPGGAVYPPLPGVLALRHRAGLPPGGGMVHQHGPGLC